MTSQALNNSNSRGEFPGVSVVIAVLNEEANLAATIRSISQQDYKGEIEIILALGPSVDKTNQIAKSLAKIDLRVKLIENPSGKTPNGLNLAIANSKFDFICRIDGHAEITNSYISDAVRILRETGAVNVGGIMNAQGSSILQSTIAIALKSRLGVGAARFHIGGSAGPADTVYLGTFQKAALVKAGGFDENFSRAQDWELNYRLRKNGGIVWFDPKLSVTYRPRSNFPKLAKQYFQYGRWRRTVSRKHKGTINIRYLMAPLLVTTLLLSLIAALTINLLFYLPIICYVMILVIGSIFIGNSLLSKLLLPAVLATMHISWGIGFLTAPRRLVKSK